MERLPPALFTKTLQMTLLYTIRLTYQGLLLYQEQVSAQAARLMLLVALAEALVEMAHQVSLFLTISQIFTLQPLA